MNSLNILSARVIGQTPPNSPASHRHRSFSEGNLSKSSSDTQPRRSASQHAKLDARKDIGDDEARQTDSQTNDENVEDIRNDIDEKSSLLEAVKPVPDLNSKYGKLRSFARKLVGYLAESLKWVMSILAAPGFYVVSSLYDEKGRFSPFRKLGWILPQDHLSKSTLQASGTSQKAEKSSSSFTGHHNSRRKSTSKTLSKTPRRKLKSTESFSPATSDSELDISQNSKSDDDSQLRNSVTLQAANPGQKNSAARRSIRIKLYNEDPARRRKDKEKQSLGNLASDAESAGKSKSNQPALIAANLKSPTSPVSSSLRLTKYPRKLAPPRPLVPRRQPSYSTQLPFHLSPIVTQKTLVIDLDETLIHSLAKGGRMSSGHMVEVKLNTTVGLGGATLGPQHPILYYVHKRPHCDEFLRKVCKWYNLVVFTASVQEYADPVIDWLEQERKYFSGRYYRQHCTFRNGAYIKDLSSVEPDLSKVMILDNSPLSYIFHEGTYGFPLKPVCPHNIRLKVKNYI